MARIFLADKLDSKYVLISETNEKVENYYHLLYKFIVNDLNIVPKSIKNVSFNINDPVYLNTFAFFVLGIAFDIDNKIPNENILDAKDVLKKDMIKVDRYVLSNNTLDMKLILPKLREAVKNTDFESVDSFLNALYEVQTNIKEVLQADSYINKLLGLTFKIEELYLISVKSNKLARKIGEEMLNKKVEAFIKYFPGSICPLRIKLSPSASVNKTLEKASKLYFDYHKNPEKIILGEKQ